METCRKTMFLGASLLLLLMLQASHASLCYNCTSNVEAECSDPFSTEGRVPVTCNQGSECAKIITNDQVSRGCIAKSNGRQSSLSGEVDGEGSDDEDCYTDVVSPTFERRIVCTCETDLCNSTGGVSYDIGFLLIVMTLPFLL